jgi:hypothetical protein
MVKVLRTSAHRQQSSIGMKHRDAAHTQTRDWTIGQSSDNNKSAEVEWRLTMGTRGFFERALLDPPRVRRPNDRTRTTIATERDVKSEERRELARRQLIAVRLNSPNESAPTRRQAENTQLVLHLT